MKDLPDNIPIDITALEIGKQIKAGDLHFDKVSILTLKDTILCTVRSTRAAAAAAATTTAKTE